MPRTCSREASICEGSPVRLHPRAERRRVLVLKAKERFLQREGSPVEGYALERRSMRIGSGDMFEDVGSQGCYSSEVHCRIIRTSGAKVDHTGDTMLVIVKDVTPTKVAMNKDGRDVAVVRVTQNPRTGHESGRHST